MREHGRRGDDKKIPEKGIFLKKGEAKDEHTKFARNFLAFESAPLNG